VSAQGAEPRALPPADDDSGYIFPTWRVYLLDAHDRVAAAYERRRRAFTAAHDAGLSYREIGEATGLTAAGAHKVVGSKSPVGLDDPVST
jgi:DNA-directed RNA polymerase specialized sigma24 family protein